MRIWDLWLFLLLSMWLDLILLLQWVRHWNLIMEWLKQFLGTEFCSCLFSQNRSFCVGFQQRCISQNTKILLKWKVVITKYDRKSFCPPLAEPPCYRMFEITNIGDVFDVFVCLILSAAKKHAAQKKTIFVSNKTKQILGLNSFDDEWSTFHLERPKPYAHCKNNPSSEKIPICLVHDLFSSIRSG